MIVFTTHIKLHDTYELPTNQNKLLSKINEYLFKKYRIIESTIQIVSEDETEVCNIT
jgi:hypothetical protein